MPRGDIWRPPVSFRGGGVSVPTGHTGPAPVPVHGSIHYFCLDSLKDTCVVCFLFFDDQSFFAEVRC